MKSNILKYSILVVLCTILLFNLTGCSGSSGVDQLAGNWNWPSRNTDDASDVTASDIYIGTSALEMNFVQDATPSTVYASNGLILLVEMKNKGASDLNGKVYLSGYDTNIINMDNKESSISLMGKSKFNLEGDYSTLTFSSTSIALPDGTDSYNPTFVLTGCYDYSTIASPIVCIDPKPQQITQNKACTPQSVGLGGGQGGPVSVTSVNVDALPDKSRFKITVQNVGSGEVVETAHCPYSLNYLDLNTVDYQVSLSNKPGTECQPKSPIRLINGQATIYCMFDVDGQDAYKAPLQIKLDYGYMNSIQKDIDVRSLY